MKILALETSCDETSAAVVKDGKEILSNVVASQVEFHRKYGGIVPEIASRKHIEVINPIIKEALDKANITFKEIDAVAVTYGPGLVGSLLVGICAAKAIAWSLGKPLIGVNHLEGHIYANFLNSKSEILNPKSRFAGSRNTLEYNNNEAGQIQNSKSQIPKFPFVCLLVSGGHTLLILVEEHGKYRTLGRTRDDAAGEAFDKIARFLGIGYPGGPIIDKMAKEGNPRAVEFKRPMLEKEYGYDFSFSGIKTAVVNQIRNQKPVTSNQIADLVASFQQAIVDVLVEKSIRAAKEYRCKAIALAGGVSANSALRRELVARAEKENIAVHIPPVEYCTDNAAMIGCSAYYELKANQISDFRLSPVASLKLG